jgi:hypothetical protein
MATQLGMSNDQYNWLLTIFYISYIIVSLLDPQLDVSDSHSSFNFKPSCGK